MTKNLHGVFNKLQLIAVIFDALCLLRFQFLTVAMNGYECLTTVHPPTPYAAPLVQCLFVQLQPDVGGKADTDTAT